MLAKYMRILYADSPCDPYCLIFLWEKKKYYQYEFLSPEAVTITVSIQLLHPVFHLKKMPLLIVLRDQHVNVQFLAKSEAQSLA